jgi:hypothetical protein
LSRRPLPTPEGGALIKLYTISPYTGGDTAVVLSAGGDTIVNLKLGLRVGMTQRTGPTPAKAAA